MRRAAEKKVTNHILFVEWFGVHSSMALREQVRVDE